MTAVQTNKKVCVVTGTRAEYGLLSNLLKEINQHASLTLQLIVCAAHLSPKHGMTIEQILADGFSIDAKVEMLGESDSDMAIAQSVAKGIIGFSTAFDQLSPDIVLVLGDRYEILAASETALLMKIPLGHIHGGEVTEGAMDDAIRHAITKMATLHFVAAEAYRTRVIQMGEQPQSVFNVGAPGLDLIQSINYLSKNQLEFDLQIKLNTPIFLVTYHPVTWGSDSGLGALKNLFKALERFPQATVIWTSANADATGNELNRLIQDWCQETYLSTKFVSSLGSQRYLSLMKLADIVIGNSSSGIIEAPALGVPTVNIGKRQKGRLRSPSVIDCDESEEQIQLAIVQAMSKPFKAIIKASKPAYGKGRAASKIIKILKSYDFNRDISKPFYDLKLEELKK